MIAYRAHGFTLIEVLVVLFIISIVTGTMLLTISSNQNRQIDAFTKNFLDTINFAEEDAMLKPVILRLKITNGSFTFQIYKAQNKPEMAWVDASDKILSTHFIPEFIQVTVKIKGADYSDNNQQIIFSENGDVTPFTIYIGKRGAKPRYAIIGEANGIITSKLLQ